MPPAPSPMNHHVTSRLPAGLLRTLFAAVLASAAAILGFINFASAFPKPSAVPIRWSLDFEPGDLRLYIDDSDHKVYWFFTYKVTNRTNQDLLFAPEFTLFTDEGDILPSGLKVPPRVEDDLLTLLGNDLMESQNQIIGEIRQGPGNARDGLVVWPATDLEVNEISMFVAGLSGDTAAVKRPGSGEEVTLRKTLQRDYLVPGSAMARSRIPAELTSESWIFR